MVFSKLVATLGCYILNYECYGVSCVSIRWGWSGTFFNFYTIILIKHTASYVDLVYIQLVYIKNTVAGPKISITKRAALL